VDRRELRHRIAQRERSVSFADTRQLLEAYGWILKRTSGSHHMFVRGNGRLSIPYRRPTMLPVYVRLILKATEADDDE
jgi:predicted RNA binding protein YcfA (HicA-like mRNA interferase family)